MTDMTDFFFHELLQPKMTFLLVNLKQISKQFLKLNNGEKNIDLFSCIFFLCSGTTQRYLFLTTQISWLDRSNDKDF